MGTIAVHFTTHLPVKKSGLIRYDMLRKLIHQCFALFHHDGSIAERTSRALQRAAERPLFQCTPVDHKKTGRADNRPSRRKPEKRSGD
ncbi:MAG TPA: hypothetical protein VLH56_10480 [Dissulfurispiraceae bacterium]|nr:hypothetical protein [Dissulfurispiraceae bacterium]